jgi:hypothetical protein
MRIRTILAASAAPAALAVVLLGTAGQASAATTPAMLTASVQQGTVHAVTHSPAHNDTTSGPAYPAVGALQSSPSGPVWAVDNMTEQFTVVPVSGQADGANYQVTIGVTGSFKGFADPGANGTTDPSLGYGQALTSSGPVKGTIEYDVYSATPPDPASLLPNQTPDTGLGAALSQLFDGQPASALIVGGGNYTFSYQNGSYVQDTIGIHGDVTGR